LTSIKEELLPSMEVLQGALSAKAEEFEKVRKIGRTHLQDAVPITLGNEFSGYARQVELAAERINAVEPRLAELALGGTAVGSGLNAHPEFAARVIKRMAQETDYPFVEAKNHYEAQAAQDAAVETSGALKTYAISLIKIANDIRWLSSGPRCGIGEMNIPSLQPGSSIMPGKVNPVIPEAVIQVAAQVIGHDATITYGGQGGWFELNVMLPVIGYNLLQSISLLSAAGLCFAEKCIQGISANEDRCASFIEQSLAMCTPLVPAIGYEKAASIAKEAFETGLTVRELALKNRVLPADEINKILDDVVKS
jgi:fumarate hydratase class II